MAQLEVDYSVLDGVKANYDGHQDFVKFQGAT